MAAAISYIGAVIAVSVATPATVDASGFNALTYTTVGKIASFGSVGDSSADISIELLDGRTEHVNGVKDGGAIPFTVRSDIDAGQTLLVNNSNNNVDLSFKITDSDGKIAYFYGKIANVKDNERAPGSYKGLTGEVRVNSATVRV
ncbi:MAG: hypothetical protein Q8K33_24205 [Cypionkella sp.]|uniref:hypothetical protein n=1 Tax=Cypionkella sp. TaxID=2811411 RepID=UPI0027303E60|nr:hypothetical protein [Cypionkella sp.]MDP2051927.1 hypothetical protein [Cypionkella sp.]